jgi:hypothetical protein
LRPTIIETAARSDPEPSKPEEQNLDRPGHERRDGKEHQEREGTCRPAPACRPGFPVQGLIEPLDKPADPGDGMPDPRIKATGITDGCFNRESEDQDRQAAGEGHGWDR